MIKFFLSYILILSLDLLTMKVYFQWLWHVNIYYDGIKICIYIFRNMKLLFFFFYYNIYMDNYCAGPGFGSAIFYQIFVNYFFFLFIELFIE